MRGAAEQSSAACGGGRARLVSWSPHDCLDSLAGQPTDRLEMPVPDCLAATVVLPDFLVAPTELS
jgi:hypothetical protein